MKKRTYFISTHASRKSTFHFEAKHFLNDDIKQFSLPEFYTDLHIHLFPVSEL